MARIFFQVISYLLHPLLIPSLGLLILFNTNTYLNFSIPSEYKQVIYLLVFLNTFCMPFLVSYIMLRRKYIKSLEMKSSGERKLPYLVTLIFYGFTLYLLREASIPHLIYLFLAGATAAVFFTLLINLKWKISAHMVGMGGLCGALIAFSLKLSVNILPFIFLFIFLSGLLGLARLKTGAHNPAQVYAGFLLGLITQLGVVLY